MNWSWRCFDGSTRRLPTPEFRHDDGQFVQTIWRDPLTASVLSRLDLNERQKKAIGYVRVNRRITNSQYRQLTGAIKKTASRDLDDLVTKQVFARSGRTGRGTSYGLALKRDSKGTKETSTPVRPRSKRPRRS